MLMSLEGFCPKQWGIWCMTFHAAAHPYITYDHKTHHKWEFEQWKHQTIHVQPKRQESWWHATDQNVSSFQQIERSMQGNTKKNTSKSFPLTMSSGGHPTCIELPFHGMNTRFFCGWLWQLITITIYPWLIAVNSSWLWIAIGNYDNTKLYLVMTTIVTTTIVMITITIHFCVFSPVSRQGGFGSRDLMVAWS